MSRESHLLAVTFFGIWHTAPAINESTYLRARARASNYCIAVLSKSMKEWVSEARWGTISSTVVDQPVWQEKVGKGMIIRWWWWWCETVMIISRERERERAQSEREKNWLEKTCVREGEFGILCCGAPWFNFIEFFWLLSWMECLYKIAICHFLERIERIINTMLHGTKVRTDCVESKQSEVSERGKGEKRRTVFLTTLLHIPHGCLPIWKFRSRKKEQQEKQGIECASQILSPRCTRTKRMLYKTCEAVPLPVPLPLFKFVETRRFGDAWQRRNGVITKVNMDLFFTYFPDRERTPV